ncbi:c2H2-type zinc-finger domain-containing protein [Ditylenchus destructor]|uniref:C2H2-type zinc-finger domain-containing protein n=1 Tax=Ditylenchus destructor TaxID=166010 RepID=A0AAD4QV72_9BILA|nr:c2H2-type zinc-finger domain-containing protein [Ditylenchus destructor]
MPRKRMHPGKSDCAIPNFSLGLTLAPIVKEECQDELSDEVGFNNVENVQVESTDITKQEMYDYLCNAMELPIGDNMGESDLSGAERDYSRGEPKTESIIKNEYNPDTKPPLAVRLMTTKSNDISNVKKKYKCDQCSHVATNSCNLLKHIFVHTGEKPYKCDQCSFACRSSPDLNRHKTVHTGEKTYKCTQCSYAASRSTTLKQHMKTHTGERSFKCKECPYAGITSSDLKRHFRFHSGDKPHKCCQCSFACSRSSQLQRHMHTHQK